jgi:hypothetical protein
MKNRRGHLTDAELLMLADGELPAEHAGEARNHLAACWTCRERIRSFEDAIANFVRFRNEMLTERIPPAPGPRALLRARLEQLSAKEKTSWKRNVAAGGRRILAQPITRRLLAAAACLVVLTGSLVLFEFTVNAEGPRPNARLTPGETRPISLSEVCSNPQAEVVVRHISLETQQKVLAAYGLKGIKAGEFEVDYLITPDLGGAETVRNLWPQPYSARWNAKVKDELEQRLHDLVCAGKLDLQTAQRDIARDWIVAYKKYMSR